ncbi:MAG: urease accessory UreF family protein [Verrucomicrobiota bacterium]|nr:urease accessory UreF family protein [Verrucomicrobiota bacterium]
MTESNTASHNEMETFHQDLSMLCHRLGEVVPGRVMAPSMRFEKVNDTDSFLRFSEQYIRYVLSPVELPAIVAASELASRNALHELYLLDKQLGSEPHIKMFEKASLTLGRNQLRKLRGMRDVRLLSRYRSSVLEGDAHGWHMLVYGIVLHLFSIPIRQGLAKYQTQVLLGFAQSACQSLQWSQSEWSEVEFVIQKMPLPSLESLSSRSQPESPQLTIV